MLQLKYQGQQITRDRNSKVYKETYIGDTASIDAQIASLTIGNYTQGKGYLRSWRKSQDNGPHYLLQIEFSESYGDNRGFTDDIVTGLKSAQLSTRTLQMPLEKADDYLTNWNHMLIAKGTSTVPIWWDTATTIKIPAADRSKYRWVKSIGQIDWDGGWEDIKGMTKPGQQYYDLSYFVVTVQASYKTASAAGSAISKSINTVTTNFAYDFGLGGQWKLDDAQVRYAGNAWLGINTYTRAYDYWDPDLYTGGVRP